VNATHTRSGFGASPLPAPHGATHPLGRFGVVFLCFLALALAPLLLASPLPLGDYANHLARLHILANLEQSEPLARYYEIQWGVIPNLASDILVPATMHWLGIGVEPAAVLFVATSLVMIASGAVVLNRALFGTWSYLSLGVFLLLYNRHFLWGFMNYVFAIGLMLWVMAAWVEVRERGHWALRLIFWLPATLLFICHLFPLGVYGLFVMAYEGGRWWRGRKAVGAAARALAGVVLAGIQFLPALGLLVLASPTAGRVGDILPGSIDNKALGLLDVFNNYSLPLDAATWLLVVGVVAVGLWRKAFRVHPAMVLPLAVLTVFYLVLPNGLFSSGGADRRLTAAIGVVAAASLGGLALPRRQLHIGVLALAALFTVRMGVIGFNWVRADSIYAHHREAMSKVDHGARVATLMAAPAFPWLLNPPIDHISTMLVVHKDAFVNGLFAEPGAQVVMPRYNRDTPFYKFPSSTYRLNTTVERERVLQTLPLDRFDWMYLVGAKEFGDLVLPSWQLVWRDDVIDTAVYKIAR
jgi:hypothetical protein